MTARFDPVEPIEEFEQIAVIGLAGRFPEAPDLERFWENLRSGRESIRSFSEDELAEIQIPEHIYRHPNFVRMGTDLPDMDRFDAGLFGYTPRQAEVIDPQARILLETSYAALEHAGYEPFSYDEPIGVFAGSNPNDYATLLGVADPTDPAGAFDRLIGTDKDFLATRISHRLNLTGPAFNVQTACSTSLVAVHLACQSLLSHECTMALAGGVSVNLRQGVGYFYQEGMILSPDGHCRAFDADAAGTTLGQGCGVVVLKRLSEAIADGDTIHAVIKATAVNNDGSGKISYTAPSEDGQARVIALAHALAGVGGDDISYVETHGTGTALGDPVEIAALTRAFAATSDRSGYCAIGSVKTNVGHTDAAAGITGLIKTVLALEHKELPPSLNYERPNPNIDFENSPFFVNTELKQWESAGPRRAGVSSFGIGGTNAHAVLEEAPAPIAGDAAPGLQLLTLSARTPQALSEMADNLATHLDRHPDLSLADVAYTLQVGRHDYEHRLAAVAGGERPAGEALRLASQGDQPVTGRTDVVFMFSGQGAQYPGMMQGLYESEPRFREELDRCAAVLEPLIDTDIRQLLFPQPGGEEAAAELLRQTAYTQPALFAVEWSLAQLFVSWGIRPAAVVGHSIGEYVAAALAGIFTFEDALRLVARRGRLMQSLPSGSMAAVQASPAVVEPLLDGSVELAAANSSRLTVVSGEQDAVEAFQRSLTERGIDNQLLHTSHAFHSQMMEPILDTFAGEVAAAAPAAPSLPILSNVTGMWMTPEQATDPGFWARQIRSPVRFADNVSQLLERGNWSFLEVGPGRALATFVRQHDSYSPESAVVTALRHPKEERSDASTALEALGRLWQAGAAPDWAALHGDARRRRLPLPTYPFQRERYWAPPARHVLALGGSEDDAAPAATRKMPLDDWFYVPSWKRAGPPVPELPATWLIFGYDDPALAGLAGDLGTGGSRVIVVTPGDGFEQLDGAFRIDPASDDDYVKLFAALAADSLLPDAVVHLWTASHLPAATMDELSGALDLGVNSVLAIARALAKQDATRPCRLEVVTSGAHSVTGEETVQPHASAVLGPCKVIPLEYANLACRNIDLSEPLSGATPAALLVAELQSEPGDVVIALRGRHRWAHDVAPVRIPAPSPQDSRIKNGGVYLIVGGLGGVGLSIAGHLAEHHRARLVLTSRSGRPDPSDETVDPELERRLLQLKQVEQAAEGLLVVKADAADEAAMQRVREAAEAEFGRIDGVIYAAGVADSAGAIHRRSRQAAEAVIASKIYGALVLERIFSDRSLDFVMLSSSIATMLYHNRFAQVGYITANSFVEAAPYRMGNGTPVITVAWDDWLEVGMSVRAAGAFSDSYGYDDITLMDPLHSFTPEEGVQVFSRALAAGHPQLYISTTDLGARIRRDVSVVSPFLERALEDEPSGGETPPVTADGIEAITAIWRDLLGFETIGVDDDFFALGGDSLQVARMADRLSHAFGVTVPLNLVFDAPTIRELHEQISTLGSGSGDGSRDGEELVEGPVPLSPGQLRFLLRGSPDPDHFNVSLLAAPREHLEAELVDRAVGEIVRHHDSLRLRLWRDDDRWVQRSEGLAGDHWTFRHVDLAATPGPEQPGAVAEIAAGLQRSLSLKAGPLVAAALFELGSGAQRLFLAAHHLAADRISLLQIVNDLQVAYRQLAASQAVELSPKTDSFQAWTTALAEYTTSPAADDDLEHWLSLPWNRIAPIPVDHQPHLGPNSNESAEAVTVTIRGAMGAGRDGGDARVDELVLAALSGALGTWTGSSHVLIDSIGHGRRQFGSDIDISRTTGFFLSYSPLLVEAEPGGGLASHVEQIRTDAERRWTIDALRYLGPDGPRHHELRALPRAEVLFNFVGRRIAADPDSFLVPVDEARGPDSAPSGLRDHSLAVYVEITNGDIELTTVFSTNLHRRETVEALVDDIVTRVEAFLRGG